MSLEKKIDKVETFDLNRIKSGVEAGVIQSGNVFYDQREVSRHQPHLDLHVNFSGGTSSSYRLYQTEGGEDFQMKPRENIKF